MSIRFDAASEGFSLTSGLPSNLVPSTWMAWVRLAADTDSFQTFFTNDATNYYAGTRADGVTLMFYNGSDHFGSALSTNTWCHVALVSSGTSRLVYLNGNLDVNFTDSISSVVPSGLYWGSTSGGSFTMNGRMAASKLHTVALSQAEIQAEMWQYMAARTANIYGVWPMRNVASAGTDFSGNSHTLTVIGTLSTEDDPPGVIWSYPEGFQAKLPNSNYLLRM